jgi:formylglycine-generating enzyme required for sulfatase activity
MYEVTQAQWEAVMGSNESESPTNLSHPVAVNWHGAQLFLAKVNETVQAEPLKFALPTEAQWEYACRAGTTTTWYFGDDSATLMQHAWLRGNSDDTTHPVGQLRPNGFGLYDMYGNKGEWCVDWYGADYYSQSPSSDPSGPNSGTRRVQRGGACRFPPSHCRSAFRGNQLPEHGGGFRPVREIPFPP